MTKMRFSIWGLLFLLTISLSAQEYRVQGTTRTIRRSSWRKHPPKRQLNKDLILSPANISAAGLGNTMRDRRRSKAEEAAYGEVKKQEYSPKENPCHHIADRKLTPEYFDKLSYGVGVSKRLRAEKSGTERELYSDERKKKIYTFILAILYTLALQPKKASWLLRMRRGISKGVFEE